MERWWSDNLPPVVSNIYALINACCLMGFWAIFIIIVPTTPACFYCPSNRKSKCFNGFKPSTLSIDIDNGYIRNLASNYADIFCVISKPLLKLFVGWVSCLILFPLNSGYLSIKRDNRESSF